MTKSYRKKTNPHTETESYKDKLNFALDEIDSLQQLDSILSQLPVGSHLEKLIYPLLEKIPINNLDEARLVYNHAPRDSELEKKTYETMVKLADLPSVDNYGDALRICELAPLHTQLREEACELMFKLSKTFDEYYSTYMKLSDKSDTKDKVFKKCLELKPNLTMSLMGSFYE